MKITRKERKAALLSSLSEVSTSLILDEEKLKNFGKNWSRGFHRYSLSNYVLIWSQCPVCSVVASYTQWKASGRYVKEGEKAIWIFAPMFRKFKVKAKGSSGSLFNNGAEEEEETEEEKIISGFIPVPVFDLSQTDGEPLDIGASDVRGKCDFTLEALASCFPYPLKRTAPGLADGATDGKTIQVAERKNKSQEIIAYFHELGHVLLGHTDKKKKFSKEQKEVEAEAVAYVVGRILGLESVDSKYYIAKFDKNRGQVEKSAVRIIGCASKILKAIDEITPRSQAQGVQAAAAASVGA